MALANKITLDQYIVGLELIEINKKRVQIDLIFRDRRTNRKFVLSYKGFLFETPNPVLNKKVQRIELNNTPGFKAITQLRFQGINPMAYKELLIQMESSTNEHKVELICVSIAFNLKPLRSKSRNTSIAKSIEKNSPVLSDKKQRQ
jgi:hypothetical protein